MTKVNPLDAFLKADMNVTKKVELKRLGIEIEVKGLDTKQVNRLRAQATFNGEINEDIFGSLLVAKACVNMDFGDKKMLEHYEASDAADCVEKALLAGELAKLSQAVSEASGFDNLEGQVKAAKN